MDDRLIRYRWNIRCAIIAALLASSFTTGATERSASARAEFVRIHHCPSTGEPRGACPGYVVDHVTPLCAGGQDHRSNMQWQTGADAKIKDVEERRMCKRRPPGT